MSGGPSQLNHEENVARKIDQFRPIPSVSPAVLRFFFS